MDYITDKTTYASVMYAKKLYHWGKTIQEAIGIASRTYGIDYKTINHYMSQNAGKKSTNKDIIFKYYIVGVFDFQDTYDSGIKRYISCKVVKAKDMEHANKTYNYSKNYYGYMFLINEVYKKLEFKSKKEAEDYLTENKETIDKEFYHNQF